MDTMKFDSPAFAHLLDGELDNEYIAYAVQIKPVLTHKMLRMHFQHQIKENVYLNCQWDPRHQPRRKWRKFLHDRANDAIWKD